VIEALEKRWDEDLSGVPLDRGELTWVARCLGGMFSSELDQRAWLRSPHPVLGKAPIEMIREGEDGLPEVAQYLVGSMQW
jgi:hypothetical protein